MEIYRLQHNQTEMKEQFEKEKVRQIKETISLLDSMILSGEQHSGDSRSMIKMAHDNAQWLESKYSKVSEDISVIDLAYFTCVLNVSGIDGLQKELTRLKEIGKNPHDIFF